MSPLLEDQLRAAFQTHAGDVSPSVDLADDARVRAARLRRTKRAQVLAGAVVIAGVVAVIPWLSTLGPRDGSAPPVQPAPSISAAPVPTSVIEQAHETRALLGTATTIVDGSGPEVLTIPVAFEDSVEGGVNQLRGVSRAAGGYVVFLAPNLPGDLSPAAADPVSVFFVRPDGSRTLLGSPETGNALTLSPDGTLVAFGTSSSAETEHVVVTDLSGRTLHQRTMTKLPGPQSVFLMSLTVDGLWLLDPLDGGPRYWDFASDSVTVPTFPETGPDKRPPSWAAQSGDRMVMLDGEAVLAYDVRDRAAPRLLWRQPAFASWAAFDGSGTRLLVDDFPGKGLALDAATGEVLDSVPLGSGGDRIGGRTIWIPDSRWLDYTELDEPLSVLVEAVTPSAEGSVSIARTSYPPYEIRYGLPVYALIGSELPPRGVAPTEAQ